MVVGREEEGGQHYHYTILACMLESAATACFEQEVCENTSTFSCLLLGYISWYELEQLVAVLEKLSIICGTTTTIKDPHYISNQTHLYRFCPPNMGWIT